MATIIEFPQERRIEQILAEMEDFDYEANTIETHLDILNDIVLDEDCELNAQRALREYCQICDLDPSGFELHWAQDATIVTIAER